MNRFMTIRGIATLLAISALALTTACAGAQKKGDETAAKAATETPAKAAAETPAKAGVETAKAGGPAAEKLPESATCPVSKRTFKPNDKTERAVHNGKTYYFCCGGCTGKFAANPDQFTAAGSAASATPQPAKTADAKPCKGDCTSACADCANKAKSATK